MQSYERGHYTYTALFCEENIWWLTRALIKEGIDENQLKVFYFSNTDKCILLFNQLAVAPGQPVLWDYHVVLKANINKKEWIFDFDTRLGFPVEFNHYLHKTFPLSKLTPLEYQSRVRIIPARFYLDHFYSDRSHMIDKIPMADFPAYPIIKPENDQAPISLFDFLDMDRALEQCDLTEVSFLYQGLDG